MGYQVFEQDVLYRVSRGVGDLGTGCRWCCVTMGCIHIVLVTLAGTELAGPRRLASSVPVGVGGVGVRVTSVFRVFPVGLRIGGEVLMGVFLDTV